MPPILPAIAREGRETNTGALEATHSASSRPVGRTCCLSAHSALGVLADFGDQGADQSGQQGRELRFVALRDVSVAWPCDAGAEAARLCRSCDVARRPSRV